MGTARNSDASSCERCKAVALDQLRRSQMVHPGSWADKSDSGDGKRVMPLFDVRELRIERVPMVEQHQLIANIAKAARLLRRG